MRPIGISRVSPLDTTNPWLPGVGLWVAMSDGVIHCLFPGCAIVSMPRGPEVHFREDFPMIFREAEDQP